MNDAVLIADNPPEKTGHRRLFGLVVVHALMTTALGLYALTPSQSKDLLFPWLDAGIDGIETGQAILLSFWIGLASSRPFQHLPIAVFGVAYLHVWDLLTRDIFAGTSHPDAEWILVEEYLTGLATNLVFFLVHVLVFAVIRWRIARFQRVAAINLLARARPQYSILQLMLLTLIVAVILGLVPRSISNDDPAFPWDELAIFGLIYVIYLVNALCATWAALSPGPVSRRMVLAFLLAALLGSCWAFASGLFAIVWWLGAYFVLVPMAVVAASLLVVRSCGYRLVPRQQPVAEVPA